MTETEIAWLAGILEGEGCFDFNKGIKGKGKYPRIRIEMKDRDIIERIKKLCGGNGQVREKQGKLDAHSTTYLYQIARRENVQKTLEAILPWMSERRASQISELLKVFS